MLEISPLRRAAEQPPCDSKAEALCLNGCFAVPERMRHYDLTPHLVCFPEHAAIWRSMKRAICDYPTVGLWLGTFTDLLRERSGGATRELMGVLDWSPQPIVDDSDDGYLIFILAYARLVRCTAARRRIHADYQEIEHDWQVADKAFRSIDEVMAFIECGRPARPPAEVGMDIP